MDEDCDFDEPRGRTRGRPRGRQRGRPRIQYKSMRNKLNKIESDDEEEEVVVKLPVENEMISSQFDKDCDISSLEAPTFTTLDRGPPAPMLQLTWNHPVNLIGEKVLSPRIHTCDSCDKPILIYGRMIPCKHVFCLWCAKREDRVCARCDERVARVEQTGLGTVFMCTFSINDDLCKRTYLSQRDLQAHIDHRHVKAAGNSAKDEKEERVSFRDPRAEVRPSIVRADIRSSVVAPPVPTPIIAAANDPRVGGNKDNLDSCDNPFGMGQFPRSFNPSQPPPSTPTLQPSPTGSTSVSHHIPVMTSSRTNLITVPIHDPPEQNYPPPSLSHPPPNHPFTSPPPISHSQPPPYSPSAIITSSYSSPYSTSQPAPHYTYPPSGGPPPPQAPIGPPPYTSTLPPVPVPPPPTTFAPSNRPHYDSQFGGGHWTTPPPTAAGQRPPPSRPISHLPSGPPRHHHPQPGNYYR